MSLKNIENNDVERVGATFLFPNGMVCTTDNNGHQIPDLQGKYSDELHNNILKHSDSKTEWNGFPNHKP